MSTVSNLARFDPAIVALVKALARQAEAEDYGKLNPKGKQDGPPPRSR